MMVTCIPYLEGQGDLVSGLGMGIIRVPMNYFMGYRVLLSPPDTPSIS